MPNDHIPCSSATRRAALAALLALSAGALGGCYPAGSVTLPTPTTASVTTTAGFPAGGAFRCVAGATWTYQLLSATGSQGNGTSIRKVDDTDEFFPDYNDMCTVRNTQIGLRAGRWRITVLLGIASNSCDVTLHDGGNNVTFTFGIAGCSS